MLARPALRWLPIALLVAACGSSPPPPAASPQPDASQPQASTDASATPAAAEAPPVVPPGDPKNLIDVSEEIVVDVPADRIMPVFELPDAYWHILPMVKSVKPKGKVGDDTLLVELEQGIAFVTGSYTARIRRTSPTTLDLAIDHRFPSVLRDGKGQVELKTEADGKTRVFFKATADIGESWPLHFIKERIRGALRKPPQLLKKYVEPRAE